MQVYGCPDSRVVLALPVRCTRAALHASEGRTVQTYAVPPPLPLASAPVEATTSSSHLANRLALFLSRFRARLH